MKAKIRHTKQILIITYIAITFGYIVWRIFFTLNINQFLFALLFLFADIVTGLSSVLFVITYWKPIQSVSMKTDSSSLTVDVFIPTFNEDIELLSRTISACLKMKYPHKTYVLDDGNRKEVKELVQRMGALYISREKNIHAKAGNLNNALAQTQGDLIAVFDADFMPKKAFITSLIGYFEEDEKMGIVQAPQYYYNQDSFQHRSLTKGKQYSDQDTFMHSVLPSRSGWNAAYWIGTNALIRRDAFLSIGGCSVDSVTEDILTSIQIHARGWKSVYVDEPLAFGLAPMDISQYYIQRLRWAKGAFQVLRKHNPISNEGLSFMQKSLYFSSLFHFIEGAVRILYYLFPAMFFVVGVIPIRSEPVIIIIISVYCLIARVFIDLVGGKAKFIYDEIYSIIRTLIYLTGFSAFFRSKKLRFAVTPKNNSSDFSIKHTLGPVIIFTFNFAVVVSAILNPSIIIRDNLLALICFAWCSYIGVLSFVACYYCFSKARNNNHFNELEHSSINFSSDTLEKEEVILGYSIGVK